ncbi:MAG: glycerol dehydrogenase [Cyanobacteriota bacterium]|jgi:glycerol-3-phosphate dehydrogenase
MNQSFDLVVIGGGASGASVAYEAVRRGLKVALLEASDLGGGTSCRSTKLLHGGVRYLELAFKTADPAQLRLVREALLERGHWLRQAPFLAHRLELALPTSNRLGQAYYRVGLGLYDALAGRTGIGSSRWLSSQQLREALPGLLPELNGGVAYSDGQFDDARLNLLLALTAEQAGAEIRTGCRVSQLERDGQGRICAVLSLGDDGREERWQAQVVVNATGIQADAIRHMADPDLPPRMLTSRGVHLVLEADLCPQGIGLLLPATDDGRVLFMLPFFGRTLVGTTDTPCPLEQAQTPSPEEHAYLLSYVQRWFPFLSELRVSSSWAGGRPLLRPAGANRSSSRVVREHEVETLSCGLVSVMGGKWTTCRPMALDTLAAVEKQLGQSLPQPTALPLLGADGSPERTPQRLCEQQQQLEELLPDTPLRQRQIAHLQANHGLEAPKLLAGWPAAERRPLSEVIPICRGELRHAIEREHARTVTDVLARRCRLAMVDQADAERLVPEVQSLLADSRTNCNLAEPSIDLRL